MKTFEKGDIMSRLDGMLNYLFVKLRKSKTNTVTITKEELITLKKEIDNEQKKLREAQGK